MSNADYLKAQALRKLTPPTGPRLGSPSPVSAYQLPKTASAAAAADIPYLPLDDDDEEEEDQYDEFGNRIPDFLLDRRYVKRRKSRKPRFSRIAADYMEKRARKKGAENKDVRIARTRLEVFIEIIGDHPVDTYTSADLQAFVTKMQCWPANKNARRPGETAFDVLERNKDLHLKPMALNTLKNGYVAVVAAALRSAMTKYSYRDPFGGARIDYPDTAAPPVSAEPLSAEKISKIFQLGVETGIMENFMLPLLGHLTGRRLGLLIHLIGNDFREKYPGVWVAQTAGITEVNGTFKRVPYKTNASTGFFVLHDFFKDIGFIDWAVSQGDKFLIPGLMRLKDPSKSGSSYMQRLFAKAGVAGDRREVFHSLRGGHIDEMLDAKIDERVRKLQVGHELSGDVHMKYGTKSLNEARSRDLARLPLNPDIDFSVFQGLNFGKLARNKRTMGRQPRKRKR
ncbi:hypothetical protein ACU5AY_11105 [Rhizobium sp. PAMB 3174]